MSRETLGEVWEGSGDPPGGPGRVGDPPKVLEQVGRPL